MELNEFLKELYGEKESMTFSELTQAAAAQKDVKFVDLKAGGYVDEGKYQDVSAKLTTAKQTIQTLQTAVQNYEGVDISDLQTQLANEKAARVKDKQAWSLSSTLAKAGCKDTGYVMYKLGDSVEFDENGAVKDPEALISTVKEAYASQFEAEHPGGTGSIGNFQRSRTADKTVTKEQFKTMGYLDRMKLKSDDPDTYNELVKE